MKAKRLVGRLILVMALCLLVASGFVAWRSHQHATGLSNIMDRHAREGLGASVGDFRALVPENLDPALQARARAWMAVVHWDPDGRMLTAQDPDAVHAFLFERAPLPDDLRDRHELSRAHVAPFQQLLASGRLCLSFAGFLPEEFADRSHAHPPAPVPPWPDRLALVMAAQWFLVEAGLAGDPEPALDALRQLLAALHPVADLSDAYAVRAIAEARDRAMLALLLRNRVSGARVAAWLDEPCTARENNAAGVRGRRLLILPVAEALRGGAPRVEPWKSGRLEALGDMAYVLWRGRYDMGCALGSLVELEARLGRPEAPTISPQVVAWQRDGGFLYYYYVPPPGMLETRVVMARAQHRMVRVAARVIRDARSTAPPEDADALRSVLGAAVGAMDAGPWDVGLRYERLTGTRFVLGPAPDSPVPPALPSRQAEWVRADHLPWYGVQVDLDLP